MKVANQRQLRTRRSLVVKIKQIMAAHQYYRSILFGSVQNPKPDKTLKSLVIVIITTATIDYLCV